MLKSMEKQNVIAALGALAQETRLDIFRYLVEVGEGGVPAGQIGERLALPPATLSFHLKTLQQAKLVLRERRSRTLIYSANYSTMNSLLIYLTKNCCAGHPEDFGVHLCEPQSTISMDSKIKNRNF